MLSTDAGSQADLEHQPGMGIDGSNFSVVDRDSALGNGEAKPYASAAGTAVFFDSIKRPENLIHLRFGYAGAIIADPDEHVGIVALQIDFHRGIPRRVADGVSE